MDRLERIRQRRDEYESTLDEAERLRDEYHREIVKLHRSGMSLREIADGLGISHQRVHQIVAPLEERSGSRRGRGKSIGAAGVAITVLLAGGIWLTRSQHPVAQRSIASPSPTERDESLAIPCLVHMSDRSAFSPITAAVQCAQGAVVVLDPRTGRVLGLANDPKVITTIDQPLQRYLEDLLRG
jgi:hypothetical protein